MPISFTHVSLKLSLSLINLIQVNQLYFDIGFEWCILRLVSVEFIVCIIGSLLCNIKLIKSLKHGCEQRFRRTKRGIEMITSRFGKSEKSNR